MSLFDDNPLNTPEPNLDSETLDRDAAALSSGEPVSAPLGGDPISFAAAAPCKEEPFLPEDLCISWSWAHLIVFLIFGFGSLYFGQFIHR